MSPEIKELGSLLETLAPHRRRFEVFSDAVFFMATALRNRLPELYSQALEDEYLRRFNSYEKDEQSVFPQLLGLLVKAIEAEPFDDHLGGMFMDCGFGDAWKGQFFTPYSISRLTAQAMFNKEEVATHIKRHGYVSLLEPSCGAGGMLIAACEALSKLGVHPYYVYFCGIDLDRTSALMCYVQMALRSVGGVVHVGNALTDKVSEVWPTPSYLLNLFPTRLKRGENDDPIFSGGLAVKPQPTRKVIKGGSVQ